MNSATINPREFISSGFALEERVRARLRNLDPAARPQLVLVLFPAVPPLDPPPLLGLLRDPPVTDRRVELELGSIALAGGCIGDEGGGMVYGESLTLVSNMFVVWL